MWGKSLNCTRQIIVEGEAGEQALHAGYLNVRRLKNKMRCPKCNNNLTPATYGQSACLNEDGSLRHIFNNEWVAGYWEGHKDATLINTMHPDSGICAVCGKKKGTSPLGSCPNFCT